MRKQASADAGSEHDQVSLSDYIRADRDAIVDEFADFARSHLESAKQLPHEALRDLASELLKHIAEDMDSEQGESERSGKSRGDAPENSPSLTEDAKEHARDRLEANFSLIEIAAEYRALRASVLRRWRAAGVGDPATAVEEVVRFNEAIDQALTESITWYSERSQRSRELLSGMIAHDLRNPLGAIVMSAHYLLRGEALGDPGAMAASRIISSANIMEKMVGDLLDFAQVRMGGQLEIAPVHMSLREVCEDAVGELRALHPDRQIDLNADPSLDGYWDRARVRQVVSNLVGNALAHGAADTPVTITVAETDEWVRLDVHNIGEPIPAANHVDIFDPLRRLPDSSAHARTPRGGIGLGLFIVKQVADAHGGSVSVASARETGTTFTVRLPNPLSAAKQ
ncbi:sensor histidine kinase [Caballeronia sp. LZ062]|uniref:sensor histidine kinase n=1 Tax=unclassified Caballeronia TaxID=2646786 RepID=UPI00285E7944|nr:MULTISPECIES: sensor histidine kinase [unclassified Caballeronia]MDR5857100.1 sensor histidine kinase [Caballeronia sp. LZ050]MDR5869504.1 sensor histidine kinase [Caballeronia sp. LZ062]